MAPGASNGIFPKTVLFMKLLLLEKIINRIFHFVNAYFLINFLFLIFFYCNNSGIRLNCRSQDGMASPSTTRNPASRLCRPPIEAEQDLMP
jgi:hypothetical protein